MKNKTKRDEFDTRITKKEINEIRGIEEETFNFDYYTSFQMNIDYFGNTQSYIQEQIRRSYNG